MSPQKIGIAIALALLIVTWVCGLAFAIALSERPGAVTIRRRARHSRSCEFRQSGAAARPKRAFARAHRRDRHPKLVRAEAASVGGFVGGEFTAIPLSGFLD